MLNAKDAAKLAAAYVPIDKHRVHIQYALDIIEIDAKAGKNKTEVYFFDGTWNSDKKYIKLVEAALLGLGYKVSKSWMFDTLKVSWSHL